MSFLYLCQFDVIFINEAIQKNVIVSMETKNWACSDPDQMIGWKNQDGRYQKCEMTSSMMSGVYAICSYSCDAQTGHMIGLRMRLQNRKIGPPPAICELTFK